MLFAKRALFYLCALLYLSVSVFACMSLPLVDMHAWLIVGSPISACLDWHSSMGDLLP